MSKEQEADTYLDDFISKLERLPASYVLGEEMQSGTRLSKTDRGARTNARIESAQKGESFDETGVDEEELEDAADDITDELLNRTLENLFGE